ncbi:MAG: sensor histidine kinase [Butyrivibrio sp.]|nr:sensor histidine kinase [Butyrivibrio sp.]
MTFLKKIRDISNSHLADQIRISYFILLLPSILFMIFAYYNLSKINDRYNNMITSVVEASKFSLDFKEDFDYETYLLIVGNVSPEDSKLPELISHARNVIDGLKDYTNTPENMKRIESALKYLSNLEGYIEKIEDNLNYEDRYDSNMIIWENDVQIVTSLVQETVNEYIYYENKQLQTAQKDSEDFYRNYIRISIGIVIFVLLSVLIVSLVGPIWITRPIEEQVKKEQKLLRKAEFEVLQAQINPHFLYNTLDAIVWSAEAGNQRQVVKMVGSLSDFFRSSLNKGKEIVTIKEEIQHVRSYLEIQQIRYQDILSYQLEVSEDLYPYHIPKITIQPIIENALYHGIKNKRGGGMIRVTGNIHDDMIEIIVADNGMGMEEGRLQAVRESLSHEKPEHSAIYGMYNVNERIKLEFGEEYGLSVDSKYGYGTTVTITLPKILT